MEDASSQGTAYRKICTEYGLEVQRSQWDMVLKVIENDQVKVVLTDQQDIVVGYKQRKKPVGTDAPEISFQKSTAPALGVQK